MGGLPVMKSMFAVLQGSNHFSALSLKCFGMLEKTELFNEAPTTTYTMTHLVEYIVYQELDLGLYTVGTSKDKDVVKPLL